MPTDMTHEQRKGQGQIQTDKLSPLEKGTKKGHIGEKREIQFYNSIQFVLVLATARKNLKANNRKNHRKNNGLGNDCLNVKEL